MSAHPGLYEGCGLGTPTAFGRRVLIELQHLGRVRVRVRVGVRVS